MTDQGALEAANRAAHKVARAAKEYAKAYEELEEFDQDRDFWVLFETRASAFIKLRRALDEYEEAERRAQRAATGEGGVDGSS